MDIIWRPGSKQTTLLSTSSLCFSKCIQVMSGIAAIHCIRMDKHLQGPLIHSQIYIFHRIIFNHLNTFGRKVILVFEIVIFFLYYNIANKGINDRYWGSYKCIDYKFSLPDVSDHCSQNGRILIFLTHCIKLTKNHTNKFSSSIKKKFPNTYKTVCVKAINLQ